MISIAIVDDHPLFRKVLLSTLSTQCKLDIKFEANNGLEALSHLSSSPPPDILLTDIRMPVMDGKELIIEITKKYPKIKVIVLSILDHEDVIQNMLHIGAKGFITKSVDVTILTHAIKTVHQNKYFIFTNINNPVFISSSLRNYVNQNIILTTRQIEFIQYCASEMTYKEIAEKMNISPRTIDAYRDQLFEKLNIKSRTGLALYAFKNGFM